MANVLNKKKKNVWVIKSQLDASIIASADILCHDLQEVGTVYHGILRLCRGRIEKNNISVRDHNRYLRLQNKKRGISTKRVPKVKGGPKVIGKIEIPDNYESKPTCGNCGCYIGKYDRTYITEVRDEVYGTWSKVEICESCYCMEVEYQIFNH